MTLGNPYRIIYEIRFDLEGGGALTLPLTRDGHAAPRRLATGCRCACDAGRLAIVGRGSGMPRDGLSVSAEEAAVD